MLNPETGRAEVGNEKLEDGRSEMAERKRRTEKLKVEMLNCGKQVAIFGRDWFSTI